MNNTLRYLSLAAAPFALLVITPACAQDQRDTLLEAALKRISALEAKVGKIDALEQENHQLRARLGKTRVRREASFATPAESNQLATIGGSADEIEPMPQINRWEGFYAGVNAGYGTNNIKTYTNEIVVDKASGTIEEAVASHDTSYIGGPVAGGQFGYNHIFANHLMLGAEADINWADVYNNATPTGTASFSIGHALASPGQIGEVNLNQTSEYRRVGMDWIGTARIRAGYDLGKFMPYVTVGLAYGALSSNFSTYEYGYDLKTVPLTPPMPPIFYMGPVGSSNTGAATTVNVGWAIGAGAEYMVADGWSVKGEYLYTSIGGVATPHYSQSIESSDTKTYTRENTGNFGVHQARIGLNYHPGWSFGETLINVKY